MSSVYQNTKTTYLNKESLFKQRKSINSDVIDFEEQ